MQTSNLNSPDWFSDYGIRHLAIIPDGNRRWALDRLRPVSEGHALGFQRLAELADDIFARNVHTVTVWCFSSENWRRADSETADLMALCNEFVRHAVMRTAERYDARVFHLGRNERLPAQLRASLQAAQEATSQHRSRVYNVAIDYSGQDELLRAGERMTAAHRTSGVAHGTLRDFLDNAGQPYLEPDLVVRTSGEMRMSGFMSYQTAYSELFFVPELFPDLTFTRLASIAEEFKGRRRSFGS